MWNLIDVTQAPYNGDLQAAVNAVPQDVPGKYGGGTVFAPRGNYNLPRPLLLHQQRTALVGDPSFGGTSLNNGFGAGPVVVVRRGAPSTTRITRALCVIMALW